MDKQVDLIKARTLLCSVYKFLLGLDALIRIGGGEIFQRIFRVGLHCLAAFRPIGGADFTVFVLSNVSHAFGVESLTYCKLECFNEPNCLINRASNRQIVDGQLSAKIDVNIIRFE